MATAGFVTSPWSATNRSARRLWIVSARKPVTLAWRQQGAGLALGGVDSAVAADAAEDVRRVAEVGVGLLRQPGGDGVGDADRPVVGGVGDHDGAVDPALGHHRPEEALARSPAEGEPAGEAVVREGALQQGQARRPHRG